MANGSNVVFIASGVEEPMRKPAVAAGFRGGRYIFLGILAVAAWLAICFAFAEHWPPRVWLMVVLGLLLGAAATA